MLHPIIRKLEVVERLSPYEKDLITAACRNVRTFPRRQDIVADGENPTALHLIVEGWAARYKVLEDGSRRITAFMMPGDFCDLHATILPSMDHAIGALTECKVAFVATETIDKITRDSAVVARAFWRATLVDEAILRQWLVNAGRRDAFQALGHLLSELHLRATLVPNAYGPDRLLPVTQEELADATGMTPVHVNRMMQQMRRQGLAETRRGGIHLSDVAALHRACRFDPAYLHLKPFDNYPVDRPLHVPEPEPAGETLARSREG